MPTNSKRSRQEVTDSGSRSLRAKQRLGKYRIEKLLATGGFAKVYAAFDTVEGIKVAIKVPHEQFLTTEMLDLFRKEVRMVAALDHPNVLRLKDASFIDGRFVVVTNLGVKTLQDRLAKRMSVETALDYAGQMIASVGYAHGLGIIHCDIKPDNFILFENGLLRLADFGIAKVSTQTIEGSGTGTVGHMAMEQAMGKPSKRSDVFSLGLIIYRMLSGCWPEYPFEWPPPGSQNLRRKRVHPDLIAFVRKSIEAKPKDRYLDAIRMEAKFDEVCPKALRHLRRNRTQGRRNGANR